MIHTIKSRTLGKEIVFSVPGKYYIFADLNGMSGTLGKQLCKGGKLWGATLGYSGNDQKEFAAICKRWYNSFLKTI